MELGAIPIINENDTVATKEIVIGDNDTLAAIVAQSVKADKLVLLSDIDGLYTADPKKNNNATLIQTVDTITDEILSIGGDAGSKMGTGGMKTKLSAAKICTDAGADMVIINGANPKLIYEVVENKNVGTRFLAKR